MIKLRKVQKEVSEYEDVVCNKCGESCASKSAFDPNEKIFNGCVNARIRGNYFSDDLEDGVEYRFDLCEKCLLDLFGTFKVPVSKVEYNLFGAVEP